MECTVTTEMDTQSSSSQVVTRSNRLEFVAIHLGAKNSKHDEQSASLAKEICESVMSNHRINSAIEAVVQLVKIMEDNPKLNCGFGSNLTMKGEVECDASLMCDKTRSWASVGAVSGCRNPIMLAKSLFDNKNKVRPLGLIPPNFLVGSGANTWMRERCSSLVVPPSRMISPKAIDKYQKLKSDYDTARRNSSRKTRLSVDQVNLAGSTSPKDDALDHSLEDSMMVDLETVGAIAIDIEGNFAAAISSGGLWLKQKGRIGQAAIPGAGCWCEDRVAVTTTGVGEYISSNLLAKRFHEYLHQARSSEQSVVPAKSNPEYIICDVIQRCYRDLYTWATLSHIQAEKLPVALMAICSFDSNPKIESDHGNSAKIFLSIAHNTQSLCVGYMSSNQNKADSKISLLDDNEVAKKAILIDAIEIKKQIVTTTVQDTKRQVFYVS